MKKYVIYSEELKGFVPEIGDELTSNVEEAKTFSKVGEAMLTASEESKKRKTIFRFYEV